jgi:anthranilate phosphoribosyltransferase
MSAYSPEFKDIIRIIGRGEKLQRDMTREEAARAMRLILSGVVGEAQLGAFFITMRVKEETVEEILGILDAAREIMPSFGASVPGLVDIGYPYDGKSRNLQTGVIASLVLAAAGVPILLHGLRDIPTKHGVGVLNLLESLGYPVNLPPEGVRQQVIQHGFGVLNLAQTLPAWAALTPIRHQFGLRTVLNSAEKLMNPANADQHISGFYHASYLIRMAAALPQGAAWVVQGDEGSIDIKPGKKTRVYRADGEQMVETMLDAADYGFPDVLALEAPNDARHHADVLRRVLDGEPIPAADAVTLTAATLLWMVGKAATIGDGVEHARDLLRSGAAARVLHPYPQPFPPTGEREQSSVNTGESQVPLL